MLCRTAMVTAGMDIMELPCSVAAGYESIAIYENTLGTDISANGSATGSGID